MSPPMTKVGEFVARRWDVEVRHFGSDVQIASTRGRALADAWRSDAFNDYSFGEFLKIARCRLSHHLPARWGDPIIVSGEAAFFIDLNSQYVQFVYPGSDVVLNSHPLDVEPQEYRPAAYRRPAPDMPLPSPPNPVEQGE